MTHPEPTGALVLIVEDNPRNLKLARDVLAHHGFRILAANTAADGIALAHQHLPNVVLMDIQLPDLDGVGALSALRGSPLTASLSVVALTAFAMPSDVERLLSAGFDGYLSKPIDVRAFPDQVRAWCKEN